MPRNSNPARYLCLFFFLFAILALGACSHSPTQTNTPAAVATRTAEFHTPAATSTPIQPTATPEPLAATVNGEGIPLAEFQVSLDQLKKADAAAQKTVNETDQRKRVLDNLVDQALLAQAARADGYQASSVDLDAQISQLAAQAGGISALQAWESANGYTDGMFKSVLAKELAAAWERDRMLAEVPTIADQVHARQILVSDEATAQTVLSRLQAGVKFASLASKYDPVSGGDLGWFPKGYLNAPEVEAAAFSLQPGQTSDIIHSRFGYHIIEVIERDPKHTLSPDARLALERAALKSWLDDQRTKSQINSLIQ